MWAVNARSIESGSSWRGWLSLVRKVLILTVPLPVLRFWRFGVNLATHCGIQNGWLVRGGERIFFDFWSGKKRGEEDFPDERVPVDKRENVMRNEKESSSKCFLELNTCP
ncbi:hypothetical protein AVEN_81359-1 [Araneus ventricosus]|uniref:Uncharacterized protein n=1 Tax=Araneus ventricosus TaxID=182803 RepID=A0A4Y2B8V3_ARAVE|nr:hypothetical protein AVEN_81359-1 [Araneus ventricosus]